METTKESGLTTNNRTNVERTSDRELVVTRTFNAPQRLVFDAWTKPELFKKWWLPKTFGLTMIACEMDVRTGGSYKLTIKHGDTPPMDFFGKYREVTPHSRIVWTNEESEEGGPVTTVTFEERNGKTTVTMHDLYPSKEALEAAVASGSCSGTGETLDQLEEVLASLGQQ